MGTIFFYIFIYFLGYYGSSILNMFSVRPIVTNRFMAALVPVFCVAMLHGYMIATRPLPASQDITVESALFSNIIMPVIIVILGAFYFMWNTRQDEEEAEEAALRAAREAEDDEDEDVNEDLEASQKASAETTNSGISGVKTASESATEETENDDTEKKSKDA